MDSEPLVLGLGTRLRHVLDLLDGDVAQVYADLGLTGCRPRFSPVVRALVALGPSSIRDIARAIGVTHSAASQTVAQMTRGGLVTLEPGADARQRIVQLTDRARSLLHVIDAEWAATGAAVEEMGAELPVPLDEMLAAILRAMERRPLRERIADAARALGDPALAPLLDRGRDTLGQPSKPGPSDVSGPIPASRQRDLRSCSVGQPPGIPETDVTRGRAGPCSVPTARRDLGDISRVSNGHLLAVAHPGPRS